MLRTISRRSRRAVTSSLMIFTMLASGCGGGGGGGNKSAGTSTAATTSGTTTTTPTGPTPTSPGLTTPITPGTVPIPGGTGTTPVTPVTPPVVPGTPPVVTPPIVNPPVTPPVAAPAFVSMTPTTGKSGDSVSIICRDIGTTPTVRFGSVAATVKSATAAAGGLVQVAVTVPANAVTGKVSLYDSKSGKTLDCGTFTVTATPTPAAPAFVSMTPLAGKVGDPVTINLRNVSVASSVKFGTVAATVKSSVAGAAGAVAINTTVPANAVTGKVYVTDPTSGKVLDCGTFTVTATPAPAAPAIVSAVLEDTNGNKVVDKGDKLTVKFSQEVVVSSTNPVGQLALGVATDSFGAGATMASGAAKTDVVVTLGTAPKLRVTGTFAAAATGTYKASGVNVAAAPTAIKNATGVVAKASAAAVDVGSTTFKEGCFQVGISMNFSRGLHSATLLDDGRVLVVGGVTANGPGTANYQRENEIYDPVTNKFTTISDPLFGSQKPRMERVDKGGKTFAVGRYAHAAVKLADGSGRVLIAGGHGFEDRDVSGAPIYGELTSCFVFDPKTKNFTETGRLNKERRDGTAIAFTSGKVLLIGGRDRDGTLKTTEVWDPATGRWTAGPSLLVDRYDAAIVPYSTGILVAGGASQTGRQTPTPTLTNVTQDEKYSTTTGTFVTSGALAGKRRAASGTILANGDVLVVGGTDANGASLASIERFDAATNKFVAAGNLKAARGRAQARRVEDDVLVVGGMAISATGGVVTVNSVETVNAQGSIQSFPLNVARLSHTVTKLVDGRVLILGGFRTPVSDIRGLDGVSNFTGEVFSRP